MTIPGCLLRDALLTAGIAGFVAIPSIRRSPYVPYRLLQRLDPVHRSPLGLAVVSGHSAVSRILKDERFGSDEMKADMSLLRVGPLNRVRIVASRRPAERGPFIRMRRSLMLFQDSPTHTRLRRLVSRSFTPPRAEAVAPRAIEIVDEILDGIEAAQAETIDLMETLAYPLPARVICELLGVPPADQHLVIAAAPPLATRLDPSPMRTAASIRAADAATETLTGYLTDAIAQRRRRPADDLLSGLVQCDDAGDGLTDDEIVGTAILLLIAGHETTANLIGNGIVALECASPDQRRQLRDDDAIAKTAIEEFLRFDPPVQIAERIALDDVDLEGVRFPARSIAILCIGAANRDPGVFVEPNRLDLTRDPNPHLAFGAGAHCCLGAPLARIEAWIALPALLRRFPKLSVIGRALRSSFTIRSRKKIELRLGHRSSGFSG
jgi:cytochrome P450